MQWLQSEKNRAIARIACFPQGGLLVVRSIFKLQGSKAEEQSMPPNTAPRASEMLLPTPKRSHF